MDVTGTLPAHRWQALLKSCVANTGSRASKIYTDGSTGALQDKPIGKRLTAIKTAKSQGNAIGTLPPDLWRIDSLCRGSGSTSPIG